MKKINTIVFDFDGVIADTLPFTFKKIIQIAKTLKYKDSDQKKIVEDIRSKDWKELLGGGGLPQFWLKLPFVLAIIYRMQVELGWEIKTIKPFPGVKKLITDLKKKGFNLVILSSNLRESIDKFIKTNNINYFDFIDAGTSTMLSKSGRLERIMKNFKLTKEQLVHVGDEIRDLEASRKIGVKFIGVCWGLHRPAILKKHGADFIAKRPSEILKIVSI